MSPASASLKRPFIERLCTTPNRYSNAMRIVYVLTLLTFGFLPALAQSSLSDALGTPPKQWASLGAATRFSISSGTGLTVAYGQQDFFAPGTDARFSFGYFSAPYYSSGFSAELSADALAYTYDPNPDAGLALVAYGGLGPRLLVQTNIYDYNYENPDPESITAFNLNVGGVGGLETRLNDFGVFLEFDVSLPALGLIGPRFQVFPFGTGLGAKLTLGTNYYF